MNGIQNLRAVNLLMTICKINSKKATVNTDRSNRDLKNLMEMLKLVHLK